MTPIVQDILTGFIGVVVFGTFAKIGYDWMKPKPIPRASNGYMTQDDINKAFIAHREHCRELLKAEFQQSIIKMESSRAASNLRLRHMEESIDGLSTRIDEVLKICMGER